jgi:hypothetical protein
MGLRYGKAKGELKKCHYFPIYLLAIMIQAIIRFFREKIQFSLDISFSIHLSNDEKKKIR